MQVIDGVAPVILDVPAERGEAHANIKPRQRHPTDVSCYMSQYRRVHHRQVVEVPATFEVFLRGEWHTQVNSRNYSAMLVLLSLQNMIQQMYARFYIAYLDIYLICWRNLKFSIWNRESTPKLLRGDICSILYSNVLINGSNQTPKLFLYQLCGHHL